MRIPDGATKGAEPGPFRGRTLKADEAWSASQLNPVFDRQGRGEGARGPFAQGVARARRSRKGRGQRLPCCLPHGRCEPAGRCVGVATEKPVVGGRRGVSGPCHERPHDRRDSAAWWWWCRRAARVPFRRRGLAGTSRCPGVGISPRGTAHSTRVLGSLGGVVTGVPDGLRGLGRGPAEAESRAVKNRRPCSEAKGTRVASAVEQRVVARGRPEWRLAADLSVSPIPAGQPTVSLPALPWTPPRPS